MTEIGSQQIGITQIGLQDKDMATKTTLQALISAFTSGGLNPASEFRTFMNAFLDSVYSPPVDETTTSNVILEATDSADYQYELRFTKQGGQVTIQGRVRNITGVYLSNTVIAKFKAGEFMPMDDFVYRGKALDITITSEIRLLVMLQDGDVVLRVSGTFPNNAGGAGGTWHEIQGVLTYNTAE